MTKQDIINKYLGKTYKHLGRAPEEGLDCWGLIKCIYADRGVNIFDLETYDPDWSRQGKNYFVEHYYTAWQKVTPPRIMDVVLFKRGGIANHAGLMLDKFHFIHASKQGVVINKIGDIRWAFKIEGFYRHHDQN